MVITPLPGLITPQIYAFGCVP